MPLSSFDLNIDQGATFSNQFTFQQADGAIYDLTGYTAMAQVRESYEGPVIATFSCTIPGTGQDGILLLEMPTTETVKLIDESYVYDVFIKSGDEIIRIMGGIVNVSPDVTREEPVI
jgi:hypothetical protein